MADTKDLRLESQPGSMIVPRSYTFAIIAIVTCSILALAPLIAIAFLPSLLEDSETVLSIAIVVIVFGGLAALHATTIARGLPRIVLDHTGIRHTTIFKKRHFRWSNSGPFSLDAQHIGIHRTFAACAFTAEKHDLMAAHGQTETPRHMNADIVVPLNMTAPGRSLKSAEAFIVELNRWLDAHGRPEQKIDGESSLEDAVALAKETRRKHRIYVIGIMIALAIASAIVTSLN